MQLNSLTAISPLDGRYLEKVQELQPIFSEFGLMRFRLLVEVKWLIALSQHPQIPEVNNLDPSDKDFLLMLYENFSFDDAKRIKEIEATTNHDVKAIEYFIKEKITENPTLEKISEFIHFACTSEDINNLSYALMLKEAKEQTLLPLMDDIILWLRKFAHDTATLPMLSRTHGQSASPTTVGKEFANFVARLQRQRDQFHLIKINGKINGAVGNFNAHQSAYPEINWNEFSQQFIKSLELHFNPYTTQIEPHDFIAEYGQAMMRFNTILIDLARDCWGYISLDYFKQNIKSDEVGSSTMPHKVNPIDFENAEGNLSLGTAILDFLSQRLPISRWQRDLVDSTLLRNLGVAMGHCVLGYKSLLKGLNKLALNENKIQQDLAQHWEVLAEPIQTVMRRHGLKNPYEQLKQFSRGKKLDEAAIKAFIQQLELSEDIKKELLELTPATYIGLAAQLALEI
jgi:adenylosuccinate lyase